MQTVTVGSRAPAFELPGVDGKTHSLAKLLENKKGLAIIFSCNHCPYVQGSEERIIALQKEYAPRGVGIVCINPNNEQTHPLDSFAEMKKRASELGFNFPYLRDQSQQVARAYNAQRTPEVYLVNAESKIVYHGRIDDSPKDAAAAKSPDLRNAIEALLQGQRPPVEKTDAIGCTIKWLPENDRPGASCSV
jgi:peroxiredoxin